MTQEHYVKIAKGAGIAIGGALLTYVLQALPHENFGAYTPLVTAVLSILINAALKWIDSRKVGPVTIDSLPQ